MKKQIVIVGSSFAGYTTAVQLAKAVGQKHNIVVIDKKPEFIFTPSMVWYPFGHDNIEKSSFDTRPIYEELDITFIQGNVYGFDLKDQQIYMSDRNIEYDYLVLATGSSPRYSSIKGLKPGKNSCTVCYDFEQAENTKKVWNEYLNDPGPMVIGFAQWAGYSFVAYEFLFNTLYYLHKEDLLGKVPVHFVTPEPYLTHLGIGGLGNDPEKALELFKSFNIQVHLNAEIHELKSSDVVLKDGTRISSSFTMIIPPFYGDNTIRTTRELADEWGRIKVTEQLHHPEYPNVFAAGGSVSVIQKSDSKVGLGIPCTHSLSEMMAKAVAQNIVTDLKGGLHVALTTDQIYDLIRKDMQYLNKMIFKEYSEVDQVLDYISKGAKKKWAENSMKKFIESAYS
ncbi:NAD(P)/FAD-dependent oxidoreductase [Balneola sp. MJW-20]|uniref:NAD(P)/FAD-dependent oxidoreductase n=1 Tax=Gracilimonas aurantiaca TaxID=3234185 RepID=UPI003467E1C8